MNENISPNAPVNSFDLSDDSERNFSMLQLLLPILKRPWILGVCFALTAAILFIYFFNQKTIYRSSSVVMLSVGGTSLMDALTMVEGTAGESKSEKYYLSILESRAFKDDVLTHIKSLYPSYADDSLAQIIDRDLGYIRSAREEGFLEIYSDSESPEFSHLLSSSALDKFMERSVFLERQDAVHVSRFIDRQVDHIKSELEVAEENLQNFLEDKNLNILDAESGITNELSELENKRNSSRANLEMIEINIETYYAQLSELYDKISSESSSDNNQRVTDLKAEINKVGQQVTAAKESGKSQEYIESLSERRAELRVELRNTFASSNEMSSDFESGGSAASIQQLEGLIEEALLQRTTYVNQVTFYENMIGRFKENHPKLSEDILMYATLSRARAVLEKTLDILLEKREEVRIRIESEMGGIRIIDEPVIPEKALPQGRSRKVVVGLVFAFLIGSLVSFIIDRFDDAIKDEKDIQKINGASVLGTIPSLSSNSINTNIDPKQKGEIGRHQLLLSNFSEKSPIAESYRTIKVSLQFLAKDQGKKVFLISSPSMSEGKSLSSANICVSFANGGAKTLLIDCDLRKSTQHKVFETQRVPGLTDYFYNDANIEDIKHETHVPNLTVIPAGKTPVNPAELLMSNAMKEFVLKMRDEYDFVIIDTPPVLVCSDSVGLNDVADGMVLIVKVESTKFSGLNRVVNMVRSFNIDILGIVLNQVEFRFGKLYYYTYQYYRPYSYYGGYYYEKDYYSEDHETDTKKKRKA